MSLFTYIERIRYVDFLIQQKATGTPAELAAKLDISLSSWHKLKEELIQDYSFPIAYCKKRRTYYYQVDGRFLFGFKVK